MLIFSSRSFRYFVLALAFLIAALLCRRGAAQSAVTVTDQRVDQAAIKAVLDDLRSGDYLLRQRAVRTLKQYPEQALTGLESLAISFDPEVQLQTRRLYNEIQSDLIKSKLQRFVSQGSAEATENSDHANSEMPLPETAAKWDAMLPLWIYFREALGDTQTTRRLYAEAVTSHTSEFMAIARDSSALEENWERLLSIDSDQQTLGRATLATILVLANRSDLWRDGGMEDRLMSEMENQIAGNAIAFRSPPFQEANRSLLVQWCQQRGIEGTKFNSYHSFLQMALQCHVPEALPRLLEVASSDKIAAYARGTAVLYAIALAPLDQMHQLEALVNDGTVVATPRYSNHPKPIECRLSDYALLGLAIRTGMDLSTLGWELPATGNVLALDRNQMGFANNREREIAIQKWLDFRRSHFPDWPESPIRIKSP